MEKAVVKITDNKSKGTKYEINYKGQTVSRISKRDYSHVIIGLGYTGNLHIFAFSGRYDLAKKELDKTIKTYKECTDIQIVELKEEK